MSMKKITVSLIMALVLCLSLQMVALAGTATKATEGYGTLTGTLYGNSYNTKVDKNPDTAYLIIKGSGTDSAGSYVLPEQQLKSERSVTSTSAAWSSIPSTVTKLWGTHGVQGGSVNPPYVVYTSTTSGW